MEVKRFDVYLIGLDPTVASEIKKTRPCVVVSPDEMKPSHARKDAKSSVSESCRSLSLTEADGRKSGRIPLNRTQVRDKMICAYVFREVLWKMNSIRLNQR